MLGGAIKSRKIDFPSMSQAQDLIKGVLPCLCFLRDLLWSISQSSCSLHGQGPHELAYLSLALVPFICLPFYPDFEL